MLYFATPSTPRIRDAMNAGHLGCITTPAQGNKIPAQAVWIADNGRFGKGWPGELAFEAWLASLRPIRDRCTLVVAPDVPFDMAGTMRLSPRWLDRIRRMGFTPALALQNGAEDMRLPWDDMGAAFIAGDTAWKLSPAAAWLTREARTRGKHVHMGRVSSLKRIRYAHGSGCDSCDGTYLRFGPDKNLAILMGWRSELLRNGAQTVI